MRQIKFHKYQATGNDFVMLDNRDGNCDDLSISQIQKLCDRRFGVGADGLIKINAHPNFDFEVDYYNADGSKSFCGNGARSSVVFAKSLGVIKEVYKFLGIDGEHSAFIDETDLVHLDMHDVNQVVCQNSDYILNTGSPHFIRFVEKLDDLNAVKFGKEIRYSSPFKDEGINVNIVEIKNESKIDMRTYERGVEDETLSCGTGATAAAIAFAVKLNLFGKHQIDVQVQGGHLQVSLNRKENENIEDVKLIGPATCVFTGEIYV